MTRHTVTIDKSNIHLYRTGTPPSLLPEKSVSSEIEATSASPLLTFNSSRLAWCVTYIDRQVLSNFPRLRRLSIEDNLQPNGLEGIQVCQNLRYLSIYRCCANINPISALTNLVALRINTQADHIRPILNCSKLRTLDINPWNKSPATDLTGIESLKELRHLSVKKNTPISFSTIAQLNRLRYLKLKHTSDLVPMPNLRYLALRLTNDDALVQLELFPQLRALNILDSYITHLGWIQHMTVLESLTINSKCSVKDIQAVASLPRLKRFVCHCKRLASVYELGQCSQLRTFDCGGTELNSLDGLGLCTNLRCVNIWNISTPRTTLSIRELATCRKIQAFRGCYISLEDIQTISNWTGLKDLNLSETHITNIDFLSGCTTIESLDISNNQIDSIDCLHAPNLWNLDAKHTRLTSIPFKRYPRLKWLNISECAISNLRELVSCNKLSCVHVDRCGLRNMDSIVAPDMVILSADDNKLTEFPFERYPKLMSLYLHSNNLTAIDGIANCPDLSTLWIKHNRVSNFSPISQLQCLNSLEYEGNPLAIQDPRTARILQRFKHRVTKTSIYNNAQNVHDTSILRSVRESVANLLKDPVATYNLSSILESDLPIETKSTIIEYCSDTYVHSMLDLTYAELFAYVWARIQGHDDCIELYKILADQLRDSECKCFTGRINRTVSVLVGFCKDISINISDSARISAIVISVGNRIEPYTVEQHITDASKALIEAGYALTEVQPWLVAISEL